MRRPRRGSWERTVVTARCLIRWKVAHAWTPPTPASSTVPRRRHVPRHFSPRPHCRAAPSDAAPPTLPPPTRAPVTAAPWPPPQPRCRPGHSPSKRRSPATPARCGVPRGRLPGTSSRRRVRTHVCACGRRHLAGWTRRVPLEEGEREAGWGAPPPALAPVLQAGPACRRSGVTCSRERCGV